MHKNNFLKLSDTTVIYVLFISKALNSMFHSTFKNWFQFCYSIYNIHHKTTSSVKGHLHKKSFTINNFEKLSVTVSAIDSCNKMQDQIGEIALNDLISGKIKWLLTDKFIKSY